MLSLLSALLIGELQRLFERASRSISVKFVSLITCVIIVQELSNFELEKTQKKTILKSYFYVGRVNF